jgi:hypothetical protein
MLGSGGAAQASSDSPWSESFSFSPGTNVVFTVPSPPAGYGPVTVTAQVAGGEGGGSAASPGISGYADYVTATLKVASGSQLRVIIGQNGAAGDPAEQSPAKGGWPGGGEGADGGGGGGGYSAVCPVTFDPNSADDPSPCQVVAGGGGGDGGEPPQAPGADQAGIGGSTAPGNGVGEWTAGPGLGAVTQTLESIPGSGGAAGGGSGALPGADGDPDMDGQGGAGGVGPSGGGGGGGGGGLEGGAGGGGGGSCGGGIASYLSCPDGYAGGGGGSQGSSSQPPDGERSGPSGGIAVIAYPVGEPDDSGEAGKFYSSGPVRQDGDATELALPLGCSGSSGSSCQLTVSVSTSPGSDMPKARKQLGAAVASSARGRTAHVVVGRMAITLAAGQSQTVQLHLDGTGAGLLRKASKLPVAVAISEVEKGKSREVLSRRVNMKGRATLAKHRVRVARMSATVGRP